MTSDTQSTWAVGSGGEPRAAIAIDVVIDVEDQRTGPGTEPGAGNALDLAWLEARLVEAASRLPKPLSRITVAVVGDRRMEDLHLAFTGRPGTTDVLAFADEDRAGGVAADIAVNVDEARRQALRRGHTVERELLLYALHGSLHAVGFDDHDPISFCAMHAQEDRILGEIGVGATFDRPGGDGTGSAPPEALP